MLKPLSNLFNIARHYANILEQKTSKKTTDSFPVSTTRNDDAAKWQFQIQTVPTFESALLAGSPNKSHERIWGWIIGGCQLLMENNAFYASTLASLTSGESVASPTDISKDRRTVVVVREKRTVLTRILKRNYLPNEIRFNNLGLCQSQIRRESESPGHKLRGKK